LRRFRMFAWDSRIALSSAAFFALRRRGSDGGVLIAEMHSQGAVLLLDLPERGGSEFCDSFTERRSDEGMPPIATQKPSMAKRHALLRGGSPRLVITRRVTLDQLQAWARRHVEPVPLARCGEQLGPFIDALVGSRRLLFQPAGMPSVSASPSRACWSSSF